MVTLVQSHSKMHIKKKYQWALCLCTVPVHFVHIYWTTHNRNIFVPVMKTQEPSRLAIKPSVCCAVLCLNQVCTVFTVDSMVWAHDSIYKAWWIDNVMYSVHGYSASPIRAICIIYIYIHYMINQMLTNRHRMKNKQNNAVDWT